MTKGRHLQIAILLLWLVSPQPGPADAVTWPAIKATIQKKFPTVRHIATSLLARWLSDKKRPAPLILDARTSAEYKVSHIKGAKLALTISAATRVIGTRPKTDPIVVYCSVGYRSAELARALQREGYSQVFNLSGSIFQWRNEGRPVFAGDTRVQKVHPYDRHWGALLNPEYRAAIPP